MSTPPIRVAVLDLYDNEPNQGMRAIQELLAAADGRFLEQRLSVEVFDVRHRGDLPDLSYDLYFSSGGPGSPFDGEGTAWEAAYFGWLDALWNHNQRADAHNRKHAVFICHSYQMMARFFEIATVNRRRTESFGIFPVHMTAAGQDDPIFADLRDPFFAADFRHWQVVRPHIGRFEALGASILALEKNRPMIPLERALMGIRVSPELVGVQFHPEADPRGMNLHFRKPERLHQIVEKHGVEKYTRILHRLEHPHFLKRTHDAVLPNFLRGAIEQLRPELLVTA